MLNHPAIHLATRPAPRPQPGKQVRFLQLTRTQIIAGLIAMGAFVEGLLALRLWIQLNAAEQASHINRIVIGMSDILVGPFEGLESTAVAAKTTGLFEFSTLVAAEVYLVAFALLMLLVLVTLSASDVKQGHDKRARSRSARRAFARRGASYGK